MFSKIPRFAPDSIILRCSTANLSCVWESLHLSQKTQDNIQRSLLKTETLNDLLRIFINRLILTKFDPTAENEKWYFSTGIQSHTNMKFVNYKNCFLHSFLVGCANFGNNRNLMGILFWVNIIFFLLQLICFDISFLHSSLISIARKVFIPHLLTFKKLFIFFMKVKYSGFNRQFYLTRVNVNYVCHK